jgi:hypothetical protein
MKKQLGLSVFMAAQAERLVQQAAEALGLCKQVQIHTFLYKSRLEWRELTLSVYNVAGPRCSPSSLQFLNSCKHEATIAGKLYESVN